MSESTLNPTQQKIAEVTKLLCDLLEASRPLSARLRVSVLGDTAAKIQDSIDYCNQISDMSMAEKSRPLDKIWEDLLSD